MLLRHRTARRTWDVRESAGGAYREKAGETAVGRSALRASRSVERRSRETKSRKVPAVGRIIPSLAQCNMKRKFGAYPTAATTPGEHGTDGAGATREIRLYTTTLKKVFNDALENESRSTSRRRPQTVSVPSERNVATCAI